MLFSRLSSFLRQGLLADAVITGATGLVMFFGAGVLARLLELPEALLRYAGLALLPFVAYVAYVATREHVHRPAVWAVILLNALWVAASIVLLLSGWVAPNALGVVFVVVQALAVAVFADIQYLGVRRSMTTAA
jgi:hypothetical protein